jgi:hypothetical protein
MAGEVSFLMSSRRRPAHTNSFSTMKEGGEAASAVFVQGGAS